MAVQLKIRVFWYVIQYRLIYSYRRFEESQCLHYKGQRLQLLDPEDEFAKTLGKLISHQSAWCNVRRPVSLIFSSKHYSRICLEELRKITTNCGYYCWSKDRVLNPRHQDSYPFDHKVRCILLKITVHFHPCSSMPPFSNQNLINLYQSPT